MSSSPPSSPPITPIPISSKRRVRFAETNLVYSAPPTPSPTFSDLSLPSSSDPPTPSFADQASHIHPEPCQNSPYIPNLPDLDPEPDPDPELAFFLSANLIPPLQHDLNAHPALITTTSPPHRPLRPDELALPALSPPRPVLHLIAHKFPWTITIHPSTDPNSVSILDVLSTLHRALRLPVTAAEFDSLPSQEDALRVCAAYEHRCRAVSDPEARSVEEQKGVKRVDFLLGRAFLGLSRVQMPAGDDVWLVNVD